MNESVWTKHDHILIGLVAQYQTMAMVHLGKIQSPVTGELDRDLDQARGLIDILEMLKVKCRTGSPAELVRMLDGAVMDLQLNYLDELKRDKAQDGGGQDGGGQAGGDQAAAAGPAEAPGPAEEPDAPDAPEAPEEDS